MGAHRPATRLIVAPALLLAGALALVFMVSSTADDARDTSLEIDDLDPIVALDVEACRRDRHETDPQPTPSFSGAGRVTSSMIVACPAAFDGRRVTYTGELIGDVIRRGGGGWVLVNDDDYALAVGPLPAHRDHRGTNSGLTVWLPDEGLAKITGMGRPNQRGDVVRLVGHIRRIDPQDGGGLTLRAEEVSVLRPSEKVEEPIRWPQAALAAGGLMAAGLLSVVRRRALR